MSVWNNWSGKFAALSAREKWLISLGGAVGLFFIVLTLFIDPLVNLNSIKQKQLESEMQQNTRLLSEISELESKVDGDPDSEIDKELEALYVESQELSMTLSEFVGGLITPSEMAELLETVLDNSTNLRLESLQSLPAEPITSSIADGESYYIHPIKLELTGKYFDIKAYLTKLEAMRIKYFWRSFEYEVTEYPQARLVLTVYTLGTKQEFIGG